ncbi:DMT family transporter [Polycladidibacter stylochi]|uniref:DMT family transporter n=1 Tax=Polycladidibacter stylochi TaxID=1807766 RepID=UPI00082B2793|nr:DMT family transporter [Pseudovibrio stylochi]
MPAPSQRLAGIGYYSVAFFFFSSCDAMIKLSASAVPVFEVAWFRYFGQFVAVLLIFRVWKNPGLLMPKRWGLQVIRAVILMIGTVLLCTALQYLQLAQTVSISFAAPFVIAAVSGPLLGEWCGPRRWAAIILGFIGVLIVVQPFDGEVHWAMLLTIAAMFCFSAYFLMTRALVQSDSNASMLMMSSLVGSILLAPPAFADFQWPDQTFEVFGLVSMGFLALTAHWLLTESYRFASASFLAPFMYQQIIWMIIYGYLIFGDTPSIHTLIGATLVICSGIYLLLRERKQLQQP